MALQKFDYYYYYYYYMASYLDEMHVVNLPGLLTGRLHGTITRPTGRSD